jgi:hypothetical protein
MADEDSLRLDQLIHEDLIAYLNARFAATSTEATGDTGV